MLLKIAKKLLRKHAYGYPAELIGEVQYMHLPLRYRGHYGNGTSQFVFDVSIGNSYINGLNSRGYISSKSRDTVLDTSPSELISVYKTLFVDVIRKTAKKHYVDLSTNDAKTLFEQYKITPEGNLTGPGLTVDPTVSTCKKCGYTNPYMDYDPNYVCKKCKVEDEWAGNASKEISAPAPVNKINNDTDADITKEHPTQPYVSVVSDGFNKIYINNWPRSGEKKRLWTLSDPENIKKARTLSGFIELLNTYFPYYFTLDEFNDLVDTMRSVYQPNKTATMKTNIQKLAEKFQRKLTKQSSSDQQRVSQFAKEMLALGYKDEEILGMVEDELMVLRSHPSRSQLTNVDLPLDSRRTEYENILNEYLAGLPDQGEEKVS